MLLSELIDEMPSASTLKAWRDEVDRWRPPIGLKAPRAIDIDMFRKVREVIRHAEGGGGMCHFVSEWIENKYHWERASGTYLASNGDVICGGGHLWNILPDGSILDATADQFGEGHDIRVIEPSDPDFQRYDLEWFEDYNPTVDYFKQEYSRRPAAAFDGEFDCDAQDRLRKARGDDWHVTDPTGRARYNARQHAYDKIYKVRRAR